MGDTEEPIVESQEIETVTVQAVPKKPRTEAQLVALEAARKKAYAMRAEKSALKKQEEASRALAKVEAQKVESKEVTPKAEVKVEEGPEGEEEPEVIYRKKPPKKKKRVVVVQEESSSDSEIEVRLPRSKNPPIATPKNPDEIRYEKAYNSLFSIDTI